MYLDRAMAHCISILSNPEMIYIIKEDVHRIYAKTTLFNIRDLSIHGFWFSWGEGGASWNQSPSDDWISYLAYKQINLH